MASVFENHGNEIHLFQQMMGMSNGAILYAISILSDAQEMTERDDIHRALNEAKELLASELDFRLKS